MMVRKNFPELGSAETKLPQLHCPTQCHLLDLHHLLHNQCDHLINTVKGGLNGRRGTEVSVHLVVAGLLAV